MNVLTMGVSQGQALVALRAYKAHRDTFDARDWEIERIYRAISKGRTVISVHDAIRAGGVDELGRPRLAIMRADQQVCLCDAWMGRNVIFRTSKRSRASEWYFDIEWPERGRTNDRQLTAQLPRIPPQHRPTKLTLADYHLLWEADWTDLPRDPMLLRRIGKDAWVVLAAWDLTNVEMSVLRAHGGFR